MRITDTPTETSTAQQIAAELRAFADFVETRPNLAEELRYTLDHLNAFCSKETWPVVLRELGSFSKSGSDSFLRANVTFGDFVGVTALIEKTETCERVQVGEREVEREVYPDDVEPTIIRDTEPIYEWKCPPSWIGEA